MRYVTIPGCCEIECGNSRAVQAPKLDFRHSDNINHFFNFVREVGLPEVSENTILLRKALD